MLQIINIKTILLNAQNNLNMLCDILRTNSVYLSSNFVH